MGVFSILCFCTLLLRVLNPSVASKDCEFPAIFNFGDSLSDTGGLSAAYDTLPWPHGISFFHMPAGRFSDGRLIIDFMANSLGLPFLHPYLDSVKANFSHGVNFAISSSSIRRPNETIWQSGWSPFPLDVQVSQFKQFKSRSQLAYNQEGVFKELLPKEDYFSRALYTIGIGSNDLTMENYIRMSKENVSVVYTDMLNQFVTGVKNIYDNGGRYFWINNIGALGCATYLLTAVPLKEGEIDKFGCATPWNKVAQDYNKRLRDTVAQLRKDLPLATFIYVDVHSAQYSLFSQPQKFGFKYTVRACCGYGGGKYNYDRMARCGNRVNGTGPIVGPCKNPFEYVIWDGIHYTESAYKETFKLIATGAYSDPALPLRTACHRRP